MFKVLAIVAAAMGGCNAQSIINGLNQMTHRVNRIIEGDVVIFSSRVRPVPEIFTCPPTEPCHLLCLESPPRPLTANKVSMPVSSSCGNMIVVAGNIPELKIICLQGACQGLQLQSSAEKNTIECLGGEACLGAKFQCGKQTPNRFLHLPVRPTVPIEACIITCSNGGCSGSADGKIPGTHVRCTGNVRECLVKANNGLDAFNYGLPAAQHRGSFTGGTMECNLHGPNSGNCQLECSDSPGQYFCRDSKYLCRSNPAKCICNDFCWRNPRCKGESGTKPDCPARKAMPHTIPTPTIKPTSNPTAMPTLKPTTGTDSPTSKPTSMPTANPTSAPTRV